MPPIGLGIGFGLQRTYGALGNESYTSYVMAGVGILGLIALFFIARRARSRLHGAKAKT